MARPSALAEISGSAVRYAVNGIKGAIKSAWILLWRTGTLWSLGYALYAAALTASGFNPFEGSLSGIFIAGGAVTLILNAAVALTNLTENPVTGASVGYRHPIWENDAHRKEIYRETAAAKDERKQEKTGRRTLSVKQCSECGYYIDCVRAEKKKHAPVPRSPRRNPDTSVVKNKDTGYRKSEYGYRNDVYTKYAKPKIYMSALEDRLIYDYPDRFEIYVVEGNSKRLERTEYK